MKRTIISVVCVILAISPLAAQGQAQSASKSAAGLGREAAAANQDLNIRAYIELLRSDVQKAKVQVMGDVMQFTGDQAATFWPIYKQFEADLAAVGDLRLAFVKEYAANYDNMTDPTADQLVQKLFGLEQQRMDLKKKYYERFKGALGAITAARFLQVENQLERLIDLQITAELPVVR
jgi:hypothetical protein